MERKGEITCEVLIKLSEEKARTAKTRTAEDFSTLSHKEITLIKMFRYLSHEKRNQAMEYNYKLTKETKRDKNILQEI